MSDSGDRRYGDPAASLWEMKRWVVVVAIVTLVSAVLVSVVTGIHMIRFGDAPNRLGTLIGIGFALLLAGGCFAGWSIYWRSLARAFRFVRESHPGGLVLGARLPDLDGGVLAESWPPQWGPALAPQRVVLRIDSSGVVFLSAAVPTAVILELAWTQVTGFARVEYVESRVAYQGLAVEGASEGSAIVVQIITPTPFVRFPQGGALREIAARAARERPCE